METQAFLNQPGWHHFMVDWGHSEDVPHSRNRRSLIIEHLEPTVILGEWAFRQPTQLGTSDRRGLPSPMAARASPF
jgi:hypothetical protein